jgi:hypothetical protein
LSVKGRQERQISISQDNSFTIPHAVPSFSVDSRNKWMVAHERVFSAPRSDPE